LTSPFSRRVAEGLKRRGLTLREFCRAVRIDASFFSKVLAGKRSPPVEEDVLRRIAAVLELDAAELVVSAGRIPSEWSGLANDKELFARVHAAATGEAAARKVAAPKAVEAAPEPVHESRHAAKRLPYGGGRKPADAGLAEELL
jgi:transcriptional regulator with XRE-family HTH domain